MAFIVRAMVERPTLGLTRPRPATLARANDLSAHFPDHEVCTPPPAFTRMLWLHTRPARTAAA